MGVHRSSDGPVSAGMLSHAFFKRDPLTCASDLIGCELVWNRCAGIVVETEAYSASGDEACHTFARPGARRFVETHDAGAAYVYLNYGVHWLLNVLVKGSEEGFVLIRALQPTRGVHLMQRRRRLTEPDALCSGPGKLSQALTVRGSDHGIDLCSKSSRCFKPRVGEVNVATDVRIGISKAAHLPWRFLLRDSPFVSIHPGKNKDRIALKTTRPL